MSTFYVSIGGSDSNAGTSITGAVKTLLKASQLATGDGDVVYLLPGTWYGESFGASGDIEIRGWGSLRGNSRIAVDGRQTGVMSHYDFGGIWQSTNITSKPSSNPYMFLTGDPSGLIELREVSSAGDLREGWWYWDSSATGVRVMNGDDDNAPLVLYGQATSWLSTNGHTVTVEDILVRHFSAGVGDGAGTGKFVGRNLLFDSCSYGIYGNQEVDLRDSWFYRCAQPFQIGGNAYFENVQSLACTYKGVFTADNSGEYYVFGQYDITGGWVSGQSGNLNVSHVLQMPVTSPFPAMRNLCLDDLGMWSGSLEMARKALEVGPFTAALVTRGREKYWEDGEDWYINGLPGVPEIASHSKSHVWCDDGRFDLSTEHDYTALKIAYAGTGTSPTVAISGSAASKVIQLRASDFSGDVSCYGQTIGDIQEIISQTGGWACWINYPNSENSDQRDTAPALWLSGLSTTSATGIVDLHWDQDKLYQEMPEMTNTRINTDVYVWPFGMCDLVTGSYKEHLRSISPSFGRGAFDNHGAADNLPHGIETWRIAAFMVTGASDLSEDRAVWYEHHGWPYNAFTHPYQYSDAEELKKVIRAFPGYGTLQRQYELLSAGFDFGNGVRGIPEQELDLTD